MNQIRKSLFIALVWIGVFSIPSSLSIEDIRHSYTSPFKTRYKEGYIYIGNEEEYNQMKDQIGENDFDVLDQRECLDSNMKVYDSYRVASSYDQESILRILLFYENLYPSKWNRSLESMKLEWEVHNALYHVKYQRERTKDVDFNNADEKRYSQAVLKRMIK